MPELRSDKPEKPLLLFDDECGVCRHIARWVRRSGFSKEGEATLVVRPIGDDPQALRILNRHLDIWDAYATIHLLMPDGSMKLGVEAVAEVLRQEVWLRSPSPRNSCSQRGVARQPGSHNRHRGAPERAGIRGRSARRSTRTTGCCGGSGFMKRIRSAFRAIRHRKSKPHFTPLSSRMGPAAVSPR
jgi:hypothetical protein